jgi:hypothetical protein
VAVKLPDMHSVNRLTPALIVGLAAGFFVWYPISDGDIFWHLAAGRHIFTTALIPHADPFCYTSQPSWQWIDLHWLYQVAMYGIESAAGLWGIVAANSALIALAAMILFAVATRAGGAWLSLPLWIAGLYEVRYLAPHRPVAFSLLFFSLFILILDRFRLHRKTRFLALLIPIQIIWVNCQPLFALGLFISGAWIAGELLERWISRTGNEYAFSWRNRALVGSGLIAATLVNPYGVGAWSLAFMHFGRIDPTHANLFAANIPENIPLLWMVGTHEARYVWATAVMTLITAAVIALQVKTARWPYVLVAAGMLFLAFRAQRNIILYFYAALPLVSAHLPPLIEFGKRRWGKAVSNASIAAVLPLWVCAATALCSHASMLAAIRAAGPLSPFSFPAESAVYLKQHHVKGNLFNADRYGGYLLWKGEGERKVFIDTRYAIRPPAFFAHYLAVLEDPALFSDLRRRFGITAACIPLSPVPRYLPLARMLSADPSWRLVRCNGAEALFVSDSCAGAPRCMLSSDATTDSIAGRIRERWAASPGIVREGLSHLSVFLTYLGLEEQARRVEAGRSDR